MNDLTSTSPFRRFSNGGVEHGPFRLNVPDLPWYAVEGLSEVRVEEPSDRFLCQTFLANPHYTFGPTRSDRHSPPGFVIWRISADDGLSLTQRRREATLSSTEENLNVQALSLGAMNKPTSARRLSPRVTPE